MELHLKADELMAYTLDQIEKEKIVPKRVRWYLGTSVGDTVLRICACLAEANSLSLDDPAEARVRAERQAEAYSATFSLSTLLFCLWRKGGLDPKAYAHWTGMLVDVQTLLHGWIRSDRRRMDEASRSKTDNG